MKYSFFSKILSLVIASAFSQNLFAQTSETIVLKPGEDLFEKYPKEVYTYPGFTFGKVYYKNGDSAGGRMNYNNLEAAIEFINNKRDTLIFSPESEVRYINIAGDIFYYNKPDYLCYVAGSASCKLAVKKSLKLTDVKKIGAYGVSTSTAKIESLDELRFQHSHKLISNEEVIFSKEKHFYLGNENDMFLPANKKNILKLFTSKKKNIQSYLDTHSVDFHNETQLLDLLNFIQNGK